MAMLKMVWDEDGKSHSMAIKYVINELEITRNQTKNKLAMFVNMRNPLVVRVDLIDPQTNEGDVFAWVERLTEKTQAMLLKIADEVNTGRFW